MAIHSDTKKLTPYTPKTSPSISGGEKAFITDELAKIAKTLTSMIEAMKLLEDRMNNNGLS